MRLPQHGRIGVGLPANLVIFRGRRYSELLSRPQHDRVGGLAGAARPRHHGSLCCWRSLPALHR